MATAQRTRPSAVVGAPRRAAWQLKSELRHSVSAAPRTIIFLQLLLVIFSLWTTMVSLDETTVGLFHELKTMHATITKTVKGAFGSSLYFQNSKHPRIGYFGTRNLCKKLSFDRLNVFFDTNKKILVLVGKTRKGLGRSVRRWNKGRQM